MRTLLILLILLGFPALEIYVLAKLAGTVGWWLLPWLLSSAIVGGWLVREAGAMLPLRLFAALQSGHSLSFSLLIGFRTVLALRAEIEGQWGGRPPAPEKYLDLGYYERALKRLGRK